MYYFNTTTRYEAKNIHYICKTNYRGIYNATENFSPCGHSHEDTAAGIQKPI